MKIENGLGKVLRNTVKDTPLLSFALVFSIAGAIAFALIPPLILEKIIDRLTNARMVAFGIAALYFASLAAAGIFESAQSVVITVFGQKITRGLRHTMCEKLTRLPAGYFTKNEAGKITFRFVNDVDTVEALFTDGIISMFADACTMLSIIVIIFVKSTGLGIIMLVVTPLLFVMTRFFQKWMLKAQLENRAAVAKVNNHVPETIRNIRMIRTFFRQEYMKRRYDKYIQESYSAVEKSNLYDSIYSPIIIFISSLIIAVMMVMSAMGGGMREFFGMSVGTAVAVIAYVGKVFAPIESIGMEIENIQSAVAGVRRINEFLREDEKRTTDPTISAEKLAASGKAPICLENVDFSYNAGENVLKGLSFSLAGGENATLTGRTGAGKSTVFRLLLGLYSPNAGSVKIYGVRADDIPDSEKRRLFGYVEQSFRLVPGTVAEQISLFDPDISREKVEWAAKLVGLHESITSFEKGYDTPAGENIFSQGQFQLLSIARAVAADPAIMLLDEITANLDSETERRVNEALERAAENRTVLSISHRLYAGGTSGRLIKIG